MACLNGSNTADYKLLFNKYAKHLGVRFYGYYCATNDANRAIRLLIYANCQAGKLA